MVVLGAIIGLAWPLQAQFAYVANYSDNTVSSYRIHRKTGALTAVPGSPFAAPGVELSARSVAVDPTGQFAYLANTLSNNVSGYSIDRKIGALTPVPGSPFAICDPVSVAVDPTGRFAYVVNRMCPAVSGYSIDNKTGALTPVPGSPFAIGSPFIVSIVTLAVDPTGQFAYMPITIFSPGGITSGTIAYSIDNKTGALTPVPGSPFAITASCVAFDPTGHFAYIANPDTLSAYSIDNKTGALTPVPGSAVATESAPTSIAVDPTGQFAYVANLESNNVSGYRIHRKTRALTPVPGSPFATGSAPTSVAVDPTAQFAYVVNEQDNTVSGYSIDRKNGALTLVPGSPFATGRFPLSIAITRH